MMISGRELGSLIATHATTPGRVTGSKPIQPTSASNTADGVTFSPESANVGRWLSALHGLPDIRAERVQSVAARVAAGQAPQATEVARQMLSRVVGDRLAAKG